MLVRRIGLAMLALAITLAVGRALTEGATWTGASVARIAMLSCAGILFLVLRGGRIAAIVGIVSLLPFVIGLVAAQRTGFDWLRAIEAVCFAGVVIVLIQPGARAVLDRKRPHPVGPMPDWVSDLGNLAAAAIWVAPLNGVSTLLFR